MMKSLDETGYGALLSPISAGSRTLRNRVIMGSMHTRLETEPDGIARQIAFYAERARGEAATRALAGEGNAVSRGFSDSFLDCLPGSQGA